MASGAVPAGAHAQGAATRDTSPVDLATPVDMAAGIAHRSAIVHVGDVRVEVLSPSLLRLEYSPSQHFENSPTVNALNRRMPVPPYSVSTSGGWLTVRTASATLRYKLGSGPFTAAQHLAPTLCRRAGPPRWRRPGTGSAPSARCARPARPP